MASGILLIDKPAGITSHDVVDAVRRVTGERTVGHAGTLDPFATGLLLVAVGRDATKHLQAYVGLDKEYEAGICLGKTSATLDPEGPITDAPCPAITAEALAAAMRSLTGSLQQIPPMHSAIKIGGKKLYQLAREGKTIERPPRAVTVYAFERRPPSNGAAASGPSLPQCPPFTLPVRIVCSSGTYVRALARDLGERLGTAGYLTALRRTRIGNFSVAQAKKLHDLTTRNWIDATEQPMLRSEP